MYASRCAARRIFRAAPDSSTLVGRLGIAMRCCSCAEMLSFGTEVTADIIQTHVFRPLLDLSFGVDLWKPQIASGKAVGLKSSRPQRNQNSGQFAVLQLAGPSV